MEFRKLQMKQANDHKITYIKHIFHSQIEPKMEDKNYPSFFNHHLLKFMPKTAFNIILGIP